MTDILITAKELVELADIGTRYIYIDADEEARLSSGGVLEILRRYEELRNPEIIEGAEQ